MKLLSLQLQNFRQHADTRVDFGPGLTGIIGPNGAGKTTILEAIAWALYGTAAARGKRESIRHLRAGARAPVRVELAFELAGHRYVVARGLTSAELYLDGTEHPIANSTTGVSEFLQRRLGMSRAEFFNTYFTGQKELNVMAAMKPVERAQFVSRVLGYEKLRDAQNLLRARRSLIKAEASGLQSALPDELAVARALSDAEARVAAADVARLAAAARRAASDEALAQLTPAWQRAQAARERHLAAQAELRVAEGEAQSYARDGERLAREVAEAAAARAERDRLAPALARLPALAEELGRQERLAREEGRRATLQDSERQAREDLARFAERRARVEQAPAIEAQALAELAARRAALDEAQRQLEAAQGNWVRDQQEAATKREELRRQYGELRAQRENIVRLGPESPCPTCTRPLGANFQTLVDDLEDRIDTLGVDGKFYKQRVEQLAERPPQVAELEERRRTLAAETTALERRVAKCQSAVVELQQLLRDVAERERRLEQVAGDLAAIPSGYDQAAHAALRAEHERLAPVQAQAARLAGLADREPALVAESARVRALGEATAARLAGVREVLAASAFSEAEYERARAAFDGAGELLRSAELQDVAAAGELATAGAAREGALRTMAGMRRTRERLDALNTERRLHDELDRAYTELREELNMALRPELSEIAGAFLEDLTDARYTQLELDDDYNIVVLEEGVPKPVISGGEEDLANLVLRLAISQMIAERAGQQFSLLILDEVFGSLDEARRQGVVDLLRALHHRFEQVIVITHIESVREGLDRVLSVTYDAARGTSVVEAADVGGGDAAADYDGDGALAADAA